MSDEPSTTTTEEQTHRHEDPLTHEPGSHPVATGVGAAGGGATGAAVGLLVGGPVGGVIGAIVGAVAGGFGGNAVGEAVEPTDPLATRVELAQAREDDLAPGDPLAETDHGSHEEETTVPTVIASRLDEWQPVGRASTTPDHEEIARRAWGYYAAQDYADGHDLEHWLRSEAELRQERTSDAA